MPKLEVRRQAASTRSFQVHARWGLKNHGGRGTVPVGITPLAGCSLKSRLQKSEEASFPPDRRKAARRDSLKRPPTLDGVGERSQQAKGCRERKRLCHNRRTTPAGPQGSEPSDGRRSDSFEAVALNRRLPRAGLVCGSSSSAQRKKGWGAATKGAGGARPSYDPPTTEDASGPSCQVRLPQPKGAGGHAAPTNPQGGSCAAPNTTNQSCDG